MCMTTVHSSFQPGPDSALIPLYDLFEITKKKINDKVSEDSDDKRLTQS